MFVTNRGVITSSDYQSAQFNSDQLVYEVIRIIDSVPLFLNDHFRRLQKSMEIQNINFRMEYQEFGQKITELVQLNRKTEGNIKFVYSTTEDEPRWIFSFIPHNYPTPEDYLRGVATNLLFAERENPNAKMVQNSVRESADQLIADQKLYEVILVDRNGLITEGSRSNVFLVKGDVFFTAPASMVLLGITRQKVFKCLNELGFQVIEEAVGANEISRFDAVFLTGTSPKVLPVRSIGNQIFNPQLLPVIKLIDCYNDLIAKYIMNEKTSGEND
ncbi:MAG: aminotransferase class IV [Bacteroidota bacterium]|nr:aminotransferase class IV [Bacteroidota bacterium]